MNKMIAAIFLVLASGVAFALDPFAYDYNTMPRTDEGRIALTLRFFTGELLTNDLDKHVKALGNEKVGEKIVEFVDGAFDVGRVSPINSPEYQLCSIGLQSLGYIKATNSLPFVKWAALHGNEGLRRNARWACREIMGYGGEYIDFLDRASREGAVSREDYAIEIGDFYRCIYSGKKNTSRESKLKVVIRLINTPCGFFASSSVNDNMLLTDFPSYANSTERLVTLAAMLENPLAPPEIHAKYGPELARLRALPPESLVHLTDELQAELDALQRAAERKEKRARILKVAVPSVVVVLIGVLVAAIVRRGKR